MGAEKSTSSKRKGALPTPQRKRLRNSEAQDVEIEIEDDDDEAVLVDEEKVPCEICGAHVAFDHYVLHMSTHLQQAEPEADITCDVCGALVPFGNFAEHAKQHSRASGVELVTCEVCHAAIRPDELADHLAAHKVHSELLDQDMKSSTCDVDITAQVVEMARSGGSGLPGNRSRVGEGDAVFVRWSDGHWYPAHVSSCEQRAYKVSWDPPYQRWASEEVPEQSVIPRMNQPREVCNFDVALEFVKRLQASKHRSSSDTLLEVVYHWTREENVHKIIENNLRPPGATNADGTAVQVLNGAAYGRGIYASTDVNFGRAYGGGLRCGFLCLAFRGRGGGRHRLGSKDDSFASDSLRVYRSSEQVLPLFFTDADTAPRLARCARDIIELLEKRALERKEGEKAWKEPQKGDQVEAEWNGSYYKAQISKVRSGRYDLTWLFPYQSWPQERGVAASRLRQSFTDWRSV